MKTETLVMGLLALGAGVWYLGRPRVTTGIIPPPPELRVTDTLSTPQALSDNQATRVNPWSTVDLTSIYAPSSGTSASAVYNPSAPYDPGYLLPKY